MLYIVFRDELDRVTIEDNTSIITTIDHVEKNGFYNGICLNDCEILESLEGEE